MGQLIAPFLILIAIGLAAVIYLLLRKKPEKADNSLLMLQQQLNHIAQIMDNKLSESNKAIQQQYGQSVKIIRDVTEKLTRLDETNKQVVNFAEQLRVLQDILKNPKQRGVLGEYYLEAVLKNVLPPDSYKIQYSFKDGAIVDAAVFIGKYIIPIDAKFSLDNYNRAVEAGDSAERKKYESAFISDIKARIEETAKYVRPEENTMDFAFMFIPSEAVFYDLLVNKVGTITGDTNSLIYYAGKKKVIIVSPTSFLAYLQTVLQGLRAMQIEESAKEIRKRVEELGKHILSYESYLQKLGNNLGTTVNMYNSAYGEFKKIDKDVIKIAGGEATVEPKALAKPKID